MATKVFYRCKKTINSNWIVGKEYEAVGGIVHGEDADAFYPCIAFGETAFDRIERDCFEASGHTWFRHTPGDPRPCDGDAWIYTLLSGNRLGSGGERYRAQYASWHCKDHKNSDIIGWRYADSERKEPAVQLAQIFGSPVAVGWEHCSGVWIGEARIADADESERNDLIAAVDDGHLTPGQKAFINAKEEKVAERLRSEAAKEELKRADHSKSIQDLANANGAVKFEHDHRLGWVQ